MSVLVPSFPSSSSSTTTPPHHHYFSTNLINGNRAQSRKHMPLLNHSTTKLDREVDPDHVPFGVVNSMKQRLLEKVNESLLLNNNATHVRSSLLKTSSRVLSNENLLQINPIISPLKRTTRLSRSQDNLSNRVEPFVLYIKPKQNVVIIDTTPSNDESTSTHRHSYSELNADEEVPKPGTVTSVKNMFERQIRLSRYDNEKTSSITTPTLSRKQRKVSNSNRARSTSPNDMALRQRRTVPVNTTSTLVSQSVPTPYPDLVISHTPSVPPRPEIKKKSNEQLLTTTTTWKKSKNKDIPLYKNTDDHRPKVLVPSTLSSDTDDDQPLDFKSCVALFNHTDTMERSNEQSPNTKKTSCSPPPFFLLKPVIHYHSDQKDRLSEQNLRSFENTTKAVTFFGGTRINEPVNSSLPAPISPLIIRKEPLPRSPSIEFSQAPDIIGGNVKLNKSSFFSGTKKNIRVQFTDNVLTYEYPSFHVAMAEYGGSSSDDDSLDDEDDNSILETHVDDVDDDELDQLARTNAKFNSNNLTEKPLQPKGSLHTFRPTHLLHYELGTHHTSSAISHSSDVFSHETDTSSSDDSMSKNEKAIFATSNNIQWSSMSTTTDLLF